LFTDASLASSGIVEQPAFITSGISNKDTFLSMWLEGVALIFLNVNIGCASPNSEVRDIWLALIEGFIWSGVGKRGCGKAIPDMNHGGKTMAPECEGKS